MSRKTESIIHKAETRCMEQGIRFTKKRKAVLSGLVESNKAMSAYELADYCKTHLDLSIPAMSVYRILDFLETNHFAHKLNIANKYIACAHISCNHAHGVQQFLICGQCEKVKEISIDQSIVQSIKNSVNEAEFHLASPQFEINCICKECYKH